MISAENLELATARKPTLSSSILVAYQGKWVSPLVHSQHNLLVEMDSWKQAETLKMQTFHMTKCRAYLQEKLNTSKRVIWSRVLVLATEEEVASALVKQEVTNIRRISIRKGEERIQTNLYPDI